MDEKQYLNRELDEKFLDIKDTLSRIEDQTKKTNGRVSTLERWQSYVLGFCACICLIIVPILFMLLDKLYS